MGYPASRDAAGPFAPESTGSTDRTTGTTGASGTTATTGTAGTPFDNAGASNVQVFQSVTGPQSPSDTSWSRRRGVPVLVKEVVYKQGEKPPPGADLPPGADAQNAARLPESSF